MSSLPRPADGDQSQSAAIVGMVIGGLTLSIVSVALRMISRKLLTNSVDWDDWTIVAAVAGSILGAGLDVSLLENGYGKHRYFLTQDQYIEFKKVGYVEWVQTFFTLLFLKISICLLLLRIVVTKSIKRPIQALIAALILSHVILALLWVFQCIPIASAWNEIKQGKCFSDEQLSSIILAQAIISIVSDFILASFPILIMHKIQISLRRKVTCCVLMGMGLITASACIVRTANNWQNVSQDETWDGVPNFMWRTVEIDIGIWAACIPTYLPLWRWLRGIRITHVNKTSSSGSRTSDKRSTSHHHLTQMNRTTVPTTVHSSTASEDLILPLHIIESHNRSKGDQKGYHTSGNVDLERGRGPFK